MRIAIRLLALGFLGLVLCLVLGGNAGMAQKKDAPLPDRVKLVRQMYAKLPPLIFEVAEPVNVVKATMYEDGGTIVVELKDAKGKELAMILDRRIGSPTRESMYVSYVPYSRKLVLLRGAEEAALYGIMLRWKTPSDTEDWTFVSGQALIEHLDRRFAAEAPTK